MKDRNIELVPDKSGDGGALVLPYGLEEFGGFVSGLLGKPQTITKEIFDPYEITKESIANLHALITQRLSSQNRAALVQFVAQVFYDDSSNVVTNDLEAFLTYHEARAVISRRATISWTFLVHFEGRSSPEKQVVELAFSRNRRVRTPAALFFIERVEPKPKISITINHTNRTWGEDIEALLTRSLAQNFRKIHWSRKLLNSNADLIFVCTVILACLASISTLELSRRAIRAESLAKASALETVDQKLDFIAESVVTRTVIPADYLIIGSVLTGFVGFAIASVFYLIAAEERPSFICFTDKAKIERDLSDKSLRYTWGQVAMGAVLSLLIGLIGKAIYDVVVHGLV